MPVIGFWGMHPHLSYIYIYHTSALVLFRFLTENSNKWSFLAAFRMSTQMQTLSQTNEYNITTSLHNLYIFLSPKPQREV